MFFHDINALPIITCDEIMKLYHKNNMNSFNIPKYTDPNFQTDPNYQFKWRKIEKFIYVTILKSLVKYKNDLLKCYNNSNINYVEKLNLELYIKHFTIKKHTSATETQLSYYNKSYNRYNCFYFIFYLNECNIPIKENDNCIYIKKGSLFIYPIDIPYKLPIINDLITISGFICHDKVHYN